MQKYFYSFAIFLIITNLHAAEKAAGDAPARFRRAETQRLIQLEEMIIAELEKQAEEHKCRIAELSILNFFAVKPDIRREYNSSTGAEVLQAESAGISMVSTHYPDGRYSCSSIAREGDTIRYTQLDKNKSRYYHLAMRDWYKEQRH